MSPLHISWSVPCLLIQGPRLMGQLPSWMFHVAMTTIKITLKRLMLAFKCYGQEWQVLFGLTTIDNYCIGSLESLQWGQIVQPPLRPNRERAMVHISKDYHADPFPQDSLQLHDHFLPLCGPKCAILPGKHCQRGPQPSKEISCDFLHHLFSLCSTTQITPTVWCSYPF